MTTVPAESKAVPMPSQVPAGPFDPSDTQLQVYQVKSDVICEYTSPSYLGEAAIVFYAYNTHHFRQFPYNVAVVFKKQRRKILMAMDVEKDYKVLAWMVVDHSNIAGLTQIDCQYVIRVGEYLNAYEEFVAAKQKEKGEQEHEPNVHPSPASALPAILQPAD